MSSLLLLSSSFDVQRDQANAPVCECLSAKAQYYGWVNVTMRRKTELIKWTRGMRCEQQWIHCYTVGLIKCEMRNVCFSMREVPCSLVILVYSDVTITTMQTDSHCAAYHRANIVNKCAHTWDDFMREHPTPMINWIQGFNRWTFKMYSDLIQLWYAKRVR